MIHLHQSPHDPAFIQNPYPFYDRARSLGPITYWEDYAMPCAFDAATVNALLRDRRLGRAAPADQRRKVPDHLVPFQAIEQHSMLELEPPTHTRLRGLVLRAFTSRRIKSLEPDIHAVTDELLAALPHDCAFDLIPAFCTQLPVRIIARLLGVPEGMAPDLLNWSNDMVAMYQAGRTREIEDAAAAAATEFSEFLTKYIDARRNKPADDLITQLIAAEEDGEKLSTDELIGTCVLLLNAGHEATVHSLGNAVKCLLENATPSEALTPSAIAGTCEELFRYTPPLHMFDRYVYEDVEIAGETLPAGSRVGLVLGAAGRDPAVYADAATFRYDRNGKPHAAFGGGLHFCVGAPLARMEMQIALPAFFARFPTLALAEEPVFSDSYHFHKLDRLMVSGLG
ncbi:cytochrome P450 [Sulfitobacter donghicola]|uniref:Cytochrome P450 n=1 Tax=Sulfitobacter donghicola DSW-25 = KCTC 12864 = JCM 14565 TaxID=1300350 RepID=A0A073IL07_9RHOB|nr:cytochrome P450 [Sulfitobacter donghicola]KEJ90270.1 cytochrome P450 [Sulfitobacter donghicola DSW-25 = KCTC 12864 = JCM 14565]KIN66560.1 Cytochrome P450 monooxygenase [Sulfitobacter donghicola DSW-25 = KCTC 12864 = JCM 14565]